MCIIKFQLVNAPMKEMTYYQHDSLSIRPIESIVRAIVCEQTQIYEKQYRHKVVFKLPMNYLSDVLYTTQSIQLLLNV